MLARGTRRRRGVTDAHDKKCAWCKHMRGSDHACTWKPRGPQDQFVSAADVSGACFGHMVASVWDGSAVRQQNKDRLKRCLAMSVSENGNGEGAPPQHAWAAALLDACKLEELRSRSANSSSGDSGSSGDDSSSGGSGSSSDGGCHCTAEVEAFRDWGTPYADVDRLLKGPQRGVMPGVLKGDGRRCRWCSHQYSVGDSVYVQHNGVSYHGTVASFPTGSGSNGVTHVGVELQRGGVRMEVRVRSTAITVPGARRQCTAWCGMAPVSSNMGTVCMGHLVAYVWGLGRGRGAPEHGCDESGWLLLPRMDLHSDPLRDGVDFNRRQCTAPHMPVREQQAAVVRAGGTAMLRV